MFLPRHYPERNHVCNRPLQFGDVQQINAIEEHDLRIRGELSIGNLEWEFAQRDGRRVFLAYVKCIRCGRYHRHVQPRRLVPEYYDSLLRADAAVEEWKCWNCGQEYVTDTSDPTRPVFVKVPDETDE